jgi:hypothetical protein
MVPYKIYIFDKRAIGTALAYTRTVLQRIVLVFAMGGLTAAGAMDARTSMNVSATVRAMAAVDLRSAPAAVDVSSDDLRRGYVDVLQPMALVIRSNSPSGYALDLMTVTPMLASLVVYGLDSEQVLGAEGGSIVQRWQHPHAVALSLRFRLVLAPGLTSGRYPWPMRISARPLDSI